MKDIDLITTVFKAKGDKKSKEEAMKSLIEQMPNNERFKKQKAAGSLGGAVRHGFLKRKVCYERIKD